MKQQQKRVWTKEATTKELWRLYKNKCDLRQKSVNEHSSGLVHAVQRHFGSWPGAFEDIGIPLNYTPRKKWHRKMILDEIKRRKKGNGSLQYRKVEEDDLNLVHAARAHFGSWREAVEAAGFDYDEICLTQKWSKAKILGRIKQLDADRIDLSHKHTIKENSKLYWVAVDRFGSWEKAVIAAGINYEEHKCKKTWNQERIIEAVRNRLDQGKRINSKSVAIEESNLYQAAQLHFGSWGAAVEASGINYEEHILWTKWSSEKVIKIIKDRIRHGQEIDLEPVTKEIKSGFVNAAIKYYGSWDKAVEAAKLDDGKISSSSKWSEEKVIDGINKLRDAGVDLISTKAQLNHVTLYRWGVKLFGSWESAVRAAEIDYDIYPVVTKWNREKVLKLIQRRMEYGQEVTLKALRKEKRGLYRAVNKYIGSLPEAVLAVQKRMEIQTKNSEEHDTAHAAR